MTKKECKMIADIVGEMYQSKYVFEDETAGKKRIMKKLHLKGKTAEKCFRIAEKGYLEAVF